jgi:periplasmic protein TonB
MFEDATFESTGRIHTRSRDWMMATFAFNGAILLTLILIPLIYPEALPHHGLSIQLTAPPTPPPPFTPKDPVRVLQGKSEMPTVVNFALPMLPRPGATAAASDDSGSALTMNIGPVISDAPPGISTGREPVHVVHADVSGPVRVSSGVMEGTAIFRSNPVYPSIALAAHVEGTVVLLATISKSGTIENLRVASGPAMLQQAAIDAVKTWRYRPYLLNGQPVEVETTVNVVFSLGR